MIKCCMLECSLISSLGDSDLEISQRGHVSKELKNLVSPWLLSGPCDRKDDEVGREVPHGEKTPACGMNLEPVIQNGVSQKEKNEYYILT